MIKVMAIVFSFVFALCLGGCGKEAASIGVIGGADGPTAVFVTSRIDWPYVCGLVGAIAVVIVIVMIYRNKKK